MTQISLAEDLSICCLYIIFPVVVMIMNICVMITALFYNNCYTVERNEGQKWFQSVKTLATAHINGGYVPCLTLYAITYIIIKC